MSEHIIRRAGLADYAAVDGLATELSGEPADRRAAFKAALAHPDRAQHAVPLQCVR